MYHLNMSGKKDPSPLAAAAKVIYDHQLSKHMRGRDRERLLSAISEFRNWFSVDLYADDDLTYCNVSISDDIANFKHETREDGSRWILQTYKVDVNWPCHGGCRTTVQSQRLAFYQKVIDMALMVERSMGEPQWTCVMTAEQVKENAENKRREVAAKSVKQRLQELVKGCGKGMRVGSRRTIEVEKEALVPTGTFTTKVKEREYSFNVQNDKDSQRIFATVERTA